MCTKTKTQYGCGHWVKVTEPCESYSCDTMDKWRFDANKDCHKCRAAGVAINRGKEGRGKCAQEIRYRTREVSSSPPCSPSASPNLSISPWLAADRSTREKKWDTPTRLKADAAWVVEHERRQSELEESKSRTTSRRGSNSSTPRNSYERIIEADEVEEPEELSSLPSQPKMKLLPFETSHDLETSRTPRHSSKHSRTSERSTSHQQALVLTTPSRRRTNYEIPHSEYEVPREISHKPRRTKTEPYYAQSCAFDPPVAIMSENHPVGEELWMQPYETVRPFEHDAYYTRTYPVY